MWWIIGGVAYVTALSFGILLFRAGKRADEQMRVLSPKPTTSHLPKLGFSSKTARASARQSDVSRGDTGDAGAHR